MMGATYHHFYGRDGRKKCANVARHEMIELQYTFLLLYLSLRTIMLHYRSLAFASSLKALLFNE